MTQYSEGFPAGKDEGGIKAAAEVGISLRLRQFYNSVQEEAIPDRLLNLLERLEAAEREANETFNMVDSAR